MINKESKKKDFYADEWYRGITKINFVPVRLATDVTLKKKAGESYSWKLFGFIPLFNVKCTENLYDLKYHSGSLTAEEINSWRQQVMFVDDIAYYRAHVTISAKTETRTEYFDNDDDAIAFVDEVTERAKKVKNTIS